MASKDKIKHAQCPRQANFMFIPVKKIPDRRRPSQTSKFHVHTHRKNRGRRESSGMYLYLQRRNASDSSYHVVKVADCLGCLGWVVHTGRKNPRRRKIAKSPRFLRFLGKVRTRLKKSFTCQFSQRPDFHVIFRW